MRSPKDIAEAIRRKSKPAQEPEELTYNDDEDFLADLDAVEEEAVEAPAAPTDYKKRIGDILRSTRGKR